MDVSGSGGGQLQSVANFCACVIACGCEISTCQESEG